MIASRFGLVKLVSKYGLTAAFTQIPKDFPQMKYLYMGMAAYTVLFVLLSILIVRFTNKASKEQEALQRESAKVASLEESMNVLVSRYGRSQAKDGKVMAELQTLTRKVSSLPPAVVRNAGMTSEVENILQTLQDMLADKCTAEAFSAAIREAQDAVDSIKRRSRIITQ